MTLETVNVEVVGKWSFIGAFVAAVVALIASAAAAAVNSRALLSVGKWALHVLTALLTVALMALLSGFLDNDFRLEYVAKHSEIQMPWGYKVAAVWAGQEGSLLLWAWMVAGMASGAVALRGRDSVKNQASTTAILAAVCGLFCVLMIFAADPFKLGQSPVPLDGQSMNPLLQDPAMIIHPPALFLGYAAATIPFAVMFGALLAGRTDKEWVPSARRWAAASWLFLTAGILLGAYWAYYTLGWGGYWGWDPVENASLLPWLTGTAVMHNLVMCQRRGMLKFWSAAMSAVTLAMCFFAAFLGRSGVVESVHAFPESPIGWTFLTMFGLTVLFSIGVITWRARLLKSERPLEEWVSLPGALILASILLVVMMLTVAVGTMFPAISGRLLEEGVVLKSEFYNTVVLPMGMTLVLLMAAGPILRVAKGLDGIARRSIIPGVVGLVAGVGAVVFAVVPSSAGLAASVLREQCLWTGVCVFGVAFGTAAIFEDFIRVLARQLRDGTQSVAQALGRFVSLHGARYAAMTVHLGVLMLAIGVLGSGLFKTHLFNAKAGEDGPALVVGQAPHALGRYTLALTGSPREVKGPNYTAVEAGFLLSGPEGSKTALTPEIRQFGSQRVGHLDFRSNLRDDVQVILEGCREDGAVFAQAIVFPLMLWVWIGGCVMGAGALACVGLIRRKTQADEAEPAGSAPLAVLDPSEQGAN